MNPCRWSRMFLLMGTRNLSDLTLQGRGNLLVRRSACSHAMDGSGHILLTWQADAILRLSPEAA